ncbi:uncharacterized protein LOC113234240, partial [Hyposmocoma kahamanoa]|uniref:uncharacterized protein LOC113234240 n=1 Tax=Hyposmocoma kahamanoa TaxID=1477025 RepID=UPI000E6D7AD8
GGNAVCQRETPKWQRPITNFFLNKEPSRESEDVEVDDQDSGSSAGTSKAKNKHNVIHSDDEDEEAEKPKNTVLDDTIELEPLNGDDSHKIEEYYLKNGVKDNSSSKNGVKDTQHVEDKVKHTENGVKDVENGVIDTDNSDDKKIREKGKGKGKKTNKENVDSNIESRISLKRDLEDIAFEEENEHVSKKIKV